MVFKIRNENVTLSNSCFYSNSKGCVNIMAFPEVSADLANSLCISLTNDAFGHMFSEFYFMH